MATGQGIHTRFPLLDTDLLKTAAAIPGPEKCRVKGLGYISKAPLRAAMRVDSRSSPQPTKACRVRPDGRLVRGPGETFLRQRVDAMMTRCQDLFVPAAINQRMQATSLARPTTLFSCGPW